MMGDATVWRRCDERGASSTHALTARAATDAGRSPISRTSPRTTATRWRRAPPTVLEGLGIPIARAPPAAVDAVGRLQAARAAGAGAGRRPRRAAARRADQPPRHPLHPLAGEVPRRLRRRARWSSRTISASSTTSPPTSSTSTTGRSPPTPATTRPSCVEKQAIRAPQGGARSSAPRRIIARQARLRRALRRQGDQGQPGAEPPQADRAHRGRGAGGELAPRAAVSLRARAAERPRRAGGRRRLARPTATSACCATSSLRVRRGEKVAIIGPNGLGKSTLLKIVIDHVDADAGTRDAGDTRCASATSRRITTRCCTTAQMTPLEYLWDACPGESTDASCAASSAACCSPATTSRSRSARCRAARRRA